MLQFAQHICDQWLQDEAFPQEFYANARTHFCIAPVHANSAVQNQIQPTIRGPLENSPHPFKFVVPCSYCDLLISKLSFDKDVHRGRRACHAIQIIGDSSFADHL